LPRPYLVEDCSLLGEGSLQFERHIRYSIILFFVVGI
jgi:hypothetical protein